MAMGAAIDSMTLLLCGLLALANVCSAQRLPEVTALNLCATAGVADFDQSGRIDISDILSTVSAFGSQNSQQDLDQSGTVDINDVLTILGYYHMDTTECLTGGGGGGDGDPPCTAEDIPIYVSPPPRLFPSTASVICQLFANRGRVSRRTVCITPARGGGPADGHRRGAGSRPGRDNESVFGRMPSMLDGSWRIRSRPRGVLSRRQ